MTAITILLANATPIAPAIGVVDVDAVDFCACDFRCEFEEVVFSDVERDGIKNDFSDFLFRKITPTDSVVIELYRYGNKVATISDDSLGTYYNGFDTEPLYVGWLADWTSIFSQFSGGQYQVKSILTILGQESTFKSRLFRLNKYDILSAHGTVKIESTQKGNIESSEFDFTDLLPGGWPSSIRLTGNFGEMSPTLNRDIYLDSSYRETQNRDNVIREYSLKCEVIPDTIYDSIATKDMLANEVFISTYDLLKEKQFERIPLVPESFADAEYSSNGRMNFAITFSDRQKNINKRNV